ncbi:MAG: BMP family ABC transporter substrate-binding protein [Firmicutes bacterium]|nr:BMP family ABC transporter substrate-binding protein [Bacillota bacterium]
MKKLLVILACCLLLAATLLCSGCGDIAAQLVDDEDGTGTDGGSEGGETAPVNTVPLALITGASGIDGPGYAAAAWAGLSAFAEEKELAADFYPAEEENQASRLAAVGRAVENGAQLIVCAGAEYGDTVYEAQNMYPQISFVLCDGEPHSLDFTAYETAANTYAVLYTDREAGYLAGYALVAEGFTKIGFMGGMPLPATVRCGAGFIQGVNQAAEDNDKEIDLFYTYTGLLQDDTSAQNLAGSWFANGIEAIYVCGDFTASVCGAAEAANAWVIASDYDRWQLSPTVISSTVKDIQGTVYQAASAWADGSFWGGKQVTLGLTNAAVKLAMDNDRFNNFTAAKLRMLLNRFDNGELEIALVNSADADLTALCGKKVRLNQE